MRRKPAEFTPYIFSRKINVFRIRIVSASMIGRIRMSNVAFTFLRYNYTTLNIICCALARHAIGPLFLKKFESENISAVQKKKIKNMCFKVSLYLFSIWNHLLHPVSLPRF